MKFSCGHWNRVPVNKIFFEQPNPIESKVKVMIPMYEPLQVSKCDKCGKVIAEPKELNAKAGQSIGLKVDQRVREGDKVYKILS